MEEYDLFISIGRACRPAHNLRRQWLRIESAPLDWQMAYSLDTVLHLFRTSFQDFFVNINEDKSYSGKYRQVIDTLNSITSIHHFPRELSLEEGQAFFLETMRDRFKRLNTRLGDAKKVVLIGNRDDSIDDLKIFLLEFSKLYPNLFLKLVSIRNNDCRISDTLIKEEYTLNDKAIVEEYIFNDSIDINTGETFDWKGNTDKWDSILSNYTTKVMNKYMDKLKQEKCVVVYGAGTKCLSIIPQLKKYNVQIQGITVSDTTQNPTSLCNIEISCIDKYPKDALIIISIANKDVQSKIVSDLCKKGYCKYVLFDRIYPMI